MDRRDYDYSKVFISVRDHGGITLGLLYDTIVASLGPEFPKNIVSGCYEGFCGDFRFVSDQKSLTKQCF